MNKCKFLAVAIFMTIANSSFGASHLDVSTWDTDFKGMTNTYDSSLAQCTWANLDECAAEWIETYDLETAYGLCYYYFGCRP